MSTDCKKGQICLRQSRNTPEDVKGQKPCKPTWPKSPKTWSLEPLPSQRIVATQSASPEATRHIQTNPAKSSLDCGGANHTLRLAVWRASHQLFKSVRS